MIQPDRIDRQSMHSHGSRDPDMMELVHELRTALDTILMSVELLTKADSFGTPIDRKYYLQHIRGAVGRIDELLIQSESKEEKKNASPSWTSLTGNSYRTGSRAIGSERLESSCT